VLAILLLRTVRPREDHQHAAFGEPCAREPLKTLLHRIVERWRMGNVEAQLHGGRHFIDVLSAGAARAGKGKDEFGLSVTSILGMTFASLRGVVANPLTAML
jgi:hypothetical protein